MPRLPSASGSPLPRWLVVAGSAAIVYHLAAIVIPYLGPVLMDKLGPIQWLTPQRLLSEPMRELLFAGTETLAL